jgi:hypothetical protein
VGRRIGDGLISRAAKASSHESTLTPPTSQREATVKKPKRRKTFRPPQPKILQSETGRDDEPFDLEAFRNRLMQGVRNMRGAGLVDVFEAEHCLPGLRKAPR